MLLDVPEWPGVTALTVVVRALVCDPASALDVVAGATSVLVGVAFLVAMDVFNKRRRASSRCVFFFFFFFLVN